jgi:hypothetical protein
MDPMLIIALAKAGVKLGVNLVALLRDEGWNPTDEELEALRAETQRQVDRFNDLVGGG